MCHWRRVEEATIPRCGRRRAETAERLDATAHACRSLARATRFLARARGVLRELREIARATSWHVARDGCPHERHARSQGGRSDRPRISSTRALARHRVVPHRRRGGRVDHGRRGRRGGEGKAAAASEAGRGVVRQGDRDLVLLPCEHARGRRVLSRVGRRARGRSPRRSRTPPHLEPQRTGRRARGEGAGARGGHTEGAEGREERGEGAPSVGAFARERSSIEAISSSERPSAGTASTQATTPAKIMSPAPSR